MTQTVLIKAYQRFLGRITEQSRHLNISTYFLIQNIYYSKQQIT